MPHGRSRILYRGREGVGVVRGEEGCEGAVLY